MSRSKRGALLLCLLLCLLLPGSWLVYLLLQPQWPASFTEPKWATAIFDRQGQLLDLHIAADQQWRLPYQAATLPPRYQTALLVFEDQYFFQHPGINPLAVARAGWSNLQAGYVKSGASTITMQVARLLEGNQPRTLVQKLRETLLALQLEWHYDKAQILQLYANHAPYGGNIVGFTAASWWYFGRDPAALSWAEAALLAVLPNSPALIHPGRRADVLLQKRDQLLRKLAARGALEAVDLQLALLEPLPKKPAGWPAQTPHLLQTLRSQWPQQPLFYSDIDQQLQQQMTALLARNARTLAISGVQNSALLVLDHQQMKVLAYVGNASGAAAMAQHQHGHAVDIIQSRRSTGSILKPFLYALMLDEGLLTTASILPDVPSQFGGYAPVNFDLQFRGAVSAADALAQSLNVPAVRMLHQYGVGRFKQQLAAFGLSTVTKGADHYGLSLILGGAEATLFELSRSYAAMMHLAGRTHSAAPSPQLQLQFPPQPPRMHDSQQMPRSEPTMEPVRLPISQGAAYLTMQTLLEVERPDSEGSWRDYVKSPKIAWKTGTSFGLRDAWAIGANGRYTIGVWTGNADGSPAAILAGARSAGPVLFDAFRLLPEAPWLRKPIAALQQVEVCESDGYRVRHQCARTTTELPVQTTLRSTYSFQQQLWLDSTGRFLLPAGCAPEQARQQQTRFILPVAMAYFYQPQHPDYHGMPPVWPGCEQLLAQQHQLPSLDLLYPSSDSQIRLPLQLDGKLGQSIFRAVHRDNTALLYWHLDDQYLGQTRMPHQMAIQTGAGLHQLVITASDGSRLQRQFEVLGNPETPR